MLYSHSEDVLILPFCNAQLQVVFPTWKLVSYCAVVAEAGSQIPSRVGRAFKGDYNEGVEGIS